MGTYLLFGLLMAIGFAVVVAARVAAEDISGIELALSIPMFFAMIVLWPLLYVAGIGLTVRASLTKTKTAGTR